MGKIGIKKLHNLKNSLIFVPIRQKQGVYHIIIPFSF